MTPRLRLLPAALGLGMAAGCPEPTDHPSPNVLVILLDDMGPDAVGIYGEIANPPVTPTLDHLATTGMRFTQAYTYPVCGPARAALLTGRYARRTGYGNNVVFDRQQYALDPSEWTMPEMVQSSPTGRYGTGAFGKWHLATESVEDYVDHPRQIGFDRYTTTVANIKTAALNEPAHAHHYTHWEEVVDGEIRHVDGYNVTHTVDQTLQVIGELGEPWMVYLPLHSAHDPWHVPPTDLQGAAVEGEDDKHVMFRAMVEAADTEIDRLLRALGPAVRARTEVIVIGDNGTYQPAIAPDWPVQGYKASLLDGGIRVPLIVNGRSVAAPGAVHDALVHIVDIFPTVADLVGVDLDQAPAVIDGQSLLPYLANPDQPGARSFLYTEWFSPNGSTSPGRFDRRVITDGTHKLFVKLEDDREQLHRVGPSPTDETPDLLEEGTPTKADLAALDELRKALAATMADFDVSP